MDHPVDDEALNYFINTIISKYIHTSQHDRDPLVIKISGSDKEKKLRELFDGKSYKEIRQIVRRLDMTNKIKYTILNNFEKYYYYHNIKILRDELGKTNKKIDDLTDKFNILVDALTLSQQI